MTQTQTDRLRNIDTDGPTDRQTDREETFPGKVLVEEHVILIQLVKVGRQFPRGLEVVHVDEGVGWSCSEIVFLWRPHRDWNDVVSANDTTILSLQGSAFGMQQFEQQIKTRTTTTKNQLD